MNQYLVLDIDKFAKEFRSYLKPALFGSGDEPVAILTAENLKDILYKSHTENVRVFEAKIPRRTGFASLDYLNGIKESEDLDLDSLIDSYKGRRY